jgi:hypothetical protein
MAGEADVVVRILHQEFGNDAMRQVALLAFEILDDGMNIFLAEILLLEIIVAVDAAFSGKASLRLAG